MMPLQIMRLVMDVRRRTDSPFDRSMRRVLLWLLVSAILFLVCEPGLTQNRTKKSRRGQVDTLFIKQGELILMSDTVYVAPKDTVFVVPPGLKVKVKENPYAKSDRFYDSLQDKSYRSKVAKQVYGLLIRSSTTELSDTLNVVKSEAPFLPYEGFTISTITLIKVDVLEGNVLDTTLYAETGIGKAANSLHVKTKDRVIFRSLLFKPGDAVRPFTLGDNERLLRDLPFIQDARIQLIPRLQPDSVVDAVVAKRKISRPTEFETQIGPGLEFTKIHTRINLNIKTGGNVFSNTKSEDHTTL